MPTASRHRPVTLCCSGGHRRDNGLFRRRLFAGADLAVHVKEMLAVLIGGVLEHGQRVDGTGQGERTHCLHQAADARCGVLALRAAHVGL